MPAKASILSIVGFRGATSLANIPLDVSKAVTVIFGENGTGKSTIADAFDFVCNRAYGSLENFSIGESAKKHLASLNSNIGQRRASRNASYRMSRRPNFASQENP
jgi:predicted ATPase